jgi:ribose 5-phosphate isomerase B
MEPKRIGIASDHGGYELKEYLKEMLIKAAYEVIDYGNKIMNQDDDYPDYVVPMAKDAAGGKLDRGIAVCGSGVGACIAINKLPGVRACLITDPFSARQGVEDDNMNVICLGGRITGNALAWELVKIFLSAQFSAAERHLRRLGKIAELEKKM